MLELTIASHLANPAFGTRTVEVSFTVGRTEWTSTRAVVFILAARQTRPPASALAQQDITPNRLILDKDGPPHGCTFSISTTAIDDLANPGAGTAKDWVMGKHGKM